MHATYQGSVILHLAAENRLGQFFDEQMKDNGLLPWEGGVNSLLVETSHFNSPIDLYGVVERIKSKGYYPLLNDPKQYNYMYDSDYHQMKSMQAKFLLNLFSLTDAYESCIRQMPNDC